MQFQFITLPSNPCHEMMNMIIMIMMLMMISRYDDQERQRDV
jgi:hypothetical protein